LSSLALRLLSRNLKYEKAKRTVRGLNISRSKELASEYSFETSWSCSPGREWASLSSLHQPGGLLRWSQAIGGWCPPGCRGSGIPGALLLFLSRRPNSFLERFGQGTKEGHNGPHFCIFTDTNERECNLRVSMKRRVELPVRVVREEELAVPKDDVQERSQSVEAEPRKKRKVVKTSVTTVTTIVTEEVDANSEEEVVHVQAQHQPETQQARENRRRLLRQLDLLKEQLLEEERQHRHHQHHQLHHHPQHEPHRHEGAAHDDTAGHAVVDDHALSQRPPFSPTPSSRLVRRSSRSSIILYILTRLCECSRLAQPSLPGSKWR